MFWLGQVIVSLTSLRDTCGHGGIRALHGDARRRFSSKPVLALIRKAGPRTVRLPPAFTSLHAFQACGCQERESNPRPEDYQSSALPTELSCGEPGWIRTTDLPVISRVLYR
jgi:hypothetical protein